VQDENKSGLLKFDIRLFRVIRSWNTAGQQEYQVRSYGLEK
jgi:hypothetical protein